MFEIKINALEIKKFPIKIEKAFFAVPEQWGVVSLKRKTENTYTAILENNDGVLLKLRIETFHPITEPNNLKKILDTGSIWSIEDVFLDAKLLHKVGITRIAYMVYENDVFTFAEINKTWHMLEVTPAFDEGLEKLIRRRLNKIESDIIRLLYTLGVYDVGVVFTDLVSLFRVTEKKVKLEKVTFENIELILKTQVTDPELENLKDLIAEYYADLT